MKFRQSYMAQRKQYQRVRLSSWSSFLLTIEYVPVQNTQNIQFIHSQ